MTLPMLGGVFAGYGPGRNAAGSTAAGTAPAGRVTRSEAAARGLARFTAPAGRIAAILADRKYGLTEKAVDALSTRVPLSGLERVLARSAGPVVAGLAGGLLAGHATGAAVGGVQQMRGATRQEKVASRLRGEVLARELVKLASSGAGKSVGAVLRQAGRVAKNVVKGSGDFGAGVAEGLGADPTIGRVVGMGTAVGAGAAGAGRAKRKVDEIRYRNGLYSQY